MAMKWYDYLAIALLTAGGLNWGAVVFNFNLVAWLSNMIGMSWIEKIIYGGVGISALYSVWSLVTGKLRG